MDWSNENRVTSVMTNLGIELILNFRHRLLHLRSARLLKSYVNDDRLQLLILDEPNVYH